mmetsp:Transcript_146978/g.469701  ORF Transcript_146978/g.469701 Transcript_146978/m.469701 type:complete len:225 (-) Transcript_146978:404-1078(-)
MPRVLLGLPATPGEDDPTHHLRSLDLLAAMSRADRSARTPAATPLLQQCIARQPARAAQRTPQRICHRPTRQQGRDPSQTPPPAVTEASESSWASWPCRRRSSAKLVHRRPYSTCSCLQPQLRHHPKSAPATRRGDWAGADPATRPGRESGPASAGRLVAGGPHRPSEGCAPRACPSAVQTPTVLARPQRCRVVVACQSAPFPEEAAKEVGVAASASPDVGRMG